MKIRLTPAAQSDLSSIWDFTLDRWDNDQAERYIREIQGTIERVAAGPEQGQDRGDIRPGYRSYEVRSHTVFYVVRDDSVDVIRTLHHRMDPSRNL